MGRAKPLIPVAGVPLLVRVVRAAREVVDEIVVVTKAAHASAMRKVLPEGVTVHTDSRRVQSPLVGFVAGADALDAEYVVFLPCDLPLLSPPLIKALFERSAGCGAATPRWAGGRVEAMVALVPRT